MPIISLINHNYRFPIQDVLRLFYGRSISDLPTSPPDIQIQAGDSDTAIQSIVETVGSSGTDEQTTYRISTVVPSRALVIRSERPIQSEIEIKRELKRQLYFICAELTGMHFPWGSLTGIRPTYVASQQIQELGAEAARRELTDFFFVEADKASLAIETATTEDRLLEDFNPDDLAIYIGIPFCPTRCSYCSFSSFEGIGRPAGEMDNYLDALIHELESIWSNPEVRAQLAPAQVRALYIGGGTPTALTAKQLQRLCDTLHSLDIPFTPDAEWTVEAGRPDTIDPEKLAILKQAGFERISVNPQSMVDETLTRIGRMHGSEAVRIAFEQSRAAGFDNINMDLIAGLAGESREEFAYSLAEVLAISPESITVHNLAVKRGSRLHRLMTESEYLHDEGQLAEQAIGTLYQPDPDVAWMVAHARMELEAAGYKPYYLYRQKDGRGGLENVGYAKPGKANLYNIAMMGDQRSVMGFGAGSSSKHGTGRQANLRNIKQYIDRIDELIERKSMMWFSTAETEA